MRELKSTKRTEDGSTVHVGQKIDDEIIEEAICPDYQSVRICVQENPKGIGYWCTRVEGHKGPHIATTDTEILAIWED